jgi:hypothetical protein
VALVALVALVASASLGRAQIPPPAPAGAAAEAGDAPAADAVRKAAEAFDEGSRAFRAGQLELAASLFEAADAAVPSAQALRMAIRARDGAGQRDRAATLAVQALERYEADAETRALAEATMTRHGPLLARVVVRCADPCVLAVGSRAVPGGAARRAVIYVEPGDAAVSATFVESGARTQRSIGIVAGAEVEIDLGPEPETPAPTPPGPATPPPPERAPTAPGPPAEGSFVESPVVFFLSAGATTILAGVTIWSGVDTVNHPGEDAVRAACAGKGTDCPEYEEGVGKQIRTNVLLGVTAGMAALTGVVGIFVTDWSGSRRTGGAPRAAVAVGQSAQGPHVELRGRW